MDQRRGAVNQDHSATPAPEAAFVEPPHTPVGPSSLKQAQRQMDALMLPRWRYASFAALGALVVSLVALGLQGDRTVVALTVVAQGVAVFSLWGMRRGFLKAAHAPWGVSTLWIAVAVPTALALAHFGHPAAELWMALLMWSFGVVQLRQGPFLAAEAVGSALWIGALLVTRPQNLPLHVVSVSASAFLGLLAFNVSHHRALNEQLLRISLEHRQDQLTAALAQAQRELEERRVAESERERIREQFVAAQRMEAIGSLAGGLAHDINNILAAVQGLAESATTQTTGTLRADMEAVVAACGRGAELTRALLGFARRTPYRQAPVGLQTVVDDASGMLMRTLPKHLSMSTQPAPEALWVSADRTHLVQALLNVCINGVHAMESQPQGRLTVAWCSRVLDAQEAAPLGVAPGPFVELRVTDTGCGMDEATRLRALEPFFTTRPLGQGTGLGLPMVYGMLRDHQGALALESALGAGTTVRMLLPQVDAPVAQDARAAPEADNTPRFAGHVLVVDDEPLVRRAQTRMLRQLGFTADEADDGLVALRMLRSSLAPYTAMILDMSMPNMAGPECLRETRTFLPTLPVVCVSGYPTQQFVQALGPGALLLSKPVSRAQLATALATVLRGPQGSVPR